MYKRQVYTGALAELIAADMAARDGLITAADLAEYRPQIRSALRTSLAGWDFATNPPPSIGGPVLAVMLGELARRPDRTWRDVLEVQRHVLEYRFHVHDHSTCLLYTSRCV